jgi:signal peptidase II
MQTTRGTSLTDQDQAAQLVGVSAGPRRLPLVIAIAVLVIALDVISKVLVVAKLSGHPPVKVIGTLLELEETRNPGAAFSIGTGTTIVFALVAIVVIGVILRTARKLVSLPWSIVLGLLLGGAAGNLIDRLVRSPGVFRGWVVDWIRLPHFAVFNLADSAITVGAALAVLLALGGRQFDGSVHKLGSRVTPNQSHEVAGSDSGPTAFEQPQPDVPVDVEHTDEATAAENADS